VQTQALTPSGTDMAGNALQGTVGVGAIVVSNFRRRRAVLQVFLVIDRLKSARTTPFCFLTLFPPLC
jgi:hypothetical protein